MIWLDTNENPCGPSPRALAAAASALSCIGRYPWHSPYPSARLKAAIAQRFGASPASVMVAAGSGEILFNAIRAFTSRDRPLVTAAPSFELPERAARHVGTPVRAVPVDDTGRLDLAGMAPAAVGAGMVFLCNPNNPTGTVHTPDAVSDFVQRVAHDSPATAIAIDEAYYEYVTRPEYGSAAALALAHPRVFVTRTFSKAYGLAGLRCGYAVGQPETIAVLESTIVPHSSNVTALAAALAALDDAEHLASERARNAEARAFTVRELRSLGCEPLDAQGNFVFVDLRRCTSDFRAACASCRVVIGRGFPPLDRTNVRISIGTMAEMREAADVFRQVLTT